MVRLRARLGGLLAGATMLAALGPPGGVHASTFQVLYSFTGRVDGGEPGTLLLDQSGDLYGTTSLINNYTAGTVYEISAHGTQTVLYTFSEGSGGYGPGGLVPDQEGNLWGSTCCGGIGGGVIFKIDRHGHESVVHVFQGKPNDGCSAGNPMAVNSPGNIYGTTFGCGKFGFGGVYKITPDGNESWLYSFRGGRDGATPRAGLSVGANNDLYGATDYGGRVKLCSNGNEGCGTIFKLTPRGLETVVYAFKGSPNDGYIPAANPIMDASGNLYGTTAAGGIGNNCEYGGCGIVFKLTSNGTETPIHYFEGGRNDGSVSIAALINDSAGNLYGTTQFGGGVLSCNAGYGCGTVFKITPDGTETILHKFKESTDGANPLAALVTDGKGHYYGTASDGGAHGYGTVFEITP